MLINALFLLAILYCGAEFICVALMFKTKKFSYWFATIHNSVFWTVFSLRYLILFADFKIFKQIESKIPKEITEFLSLLSAEKFDTELLFIFSLYTLIFVGAAIRFFVGYGTIKFNQIVALGILLSTVMNSNQTPSVNIYTTLFIAALILWIAAVISNKLVIAHIKNKNTKTNLDLTKNKEEAQNNV